MLDGALLINKNNTLTSFAVVEQIKLKILKIFDLNKKTMPKVGHGGTLDPFATGLLIILVGKGVKLAQYFLGATKAYQGVFLFGETTAPGDPTAPVIERSSHIPQSLDLLQDLATRLTLQDYEQIPPMYSAKKFQGKPLYQFARQGKEVERELKKCRLYDFKIDSYQNARAHFQLTCSSGTYVRTLAQDFAKMLGTVGLLETLERTAIGNFSLQSSITLEQLDQALNNAQLNPLPIWSSLPCWIPFDQLLSGYTQVEVSRDQASALLLGKQAVLSELTKNTQKSDQLLTIYHRQQLLAVAKKEKHLWKLEKVFHLP